MNLARSAVLARRPNFASHPNRRRRFKIKPAEDADSIEGLQLWTLCGVRESSSQVKALNAWAKVRRIESHNFGIVSGRFRKDIFIRGDEVGQLHAVAEGIASWTQDMSLQVDGVGVIRSDGEDVDQIAVLNLKGG